jgi:hypothetical protein
LPPQQAFEQWHVIARHRGSAQACAKLAEMRRKGTRDGSQSVGIELTQEITALSPRRAHGQRCDCSSGVQERACGGDELQRPGPAGYAAALGLSSHALRAYDAIARCLTSHRILDPGRLQLPRAAPHLPPLQQNNMRRAGVALLRLSQWEGEKEGRSFGGARRMNAATQTAGQFADNR